MGKFCFDKLKENSRISKELLRKALIGASQEFINNDDKFVISYNCDNCPYRGLSKDKYQDKCNKFCTFREFKEEIRVPEISYKNKRIINSETGKEVTISMPYVVYNSRAKALPKTAIKVFLLYHFLNKDNYIIKNVSLNDIADTLGVAVASIKRSNEVLQALNFIHVVEVSHNIFNIIITDLDKLHLKKEQGGKGYITLSKNTLKKMLSFNDINNLRAEVNYNLNADNSAKENKQISNMSMNNIKKIFPPYLRKGRKNIEGILTNKNSMFNVLAVDFKRNIVEVDISSYQGREELRNSLEGSIYTELDNFIKNNKICIVSKEETTLDPEEPVGVDYYIDVIEKGSTFEERYNNRLKNLVELAIEYGTYNIKSLLLYIQRIYIIGEGIAIRNLGGFIRTKMISHIRSMGSCVDIAV